MENANELYNTARFYCDSGWSVIPIWGQAQPGKFKVPAIRWRQFQFRQPTLAELNYWFEQRQFGGVGVVCGRISQLAVLDFDDPALASLFQQLHPDLAQTYTVRSGGRGLPHFYYHIPTHLETSTTHAPGVDWQFDGAYVIAPPTALADGAWTEINNCAPKILSVADLERIVAFVEASKRKPDSATQIENENAVAYVPLPDTMTPSRRLVRRYYLDHLSLGRNNALFKTSCWLRDQGYTVSDAMPLVALHVRQPPPAGHHPETPAQRRDEALKTIMSAFSRAARTPKREALSSIPNQLREQLLSDKQAAVLRVLEVIFRSDWAPGDIFDRQALLDLTSTYGIGDWSVRKALAATMITQRPFFVQVEGVATTAIAASGNDAKASELNAIELRVTAPTKKGRGRPTIYYSVPSIVELCRLYEITYMAGDHLPDGALGSAKAYRNALHQALLARRPGEYHREWLANRLGVSVRTLCRYNTDHRVVVLPRYLSYRVSWHNIRQVMPADLDHAAMSPYGAFLEDDEGKRYPPFVPIARRLLSQKRAVVYKRQIQNHYSLRPELPPPQKSPSPSEQAIRVVSQPVQQLQEPTEVPLPKEETGPQAPRLQEVGRPLGELDERVAEALYVVGRGRLSKRRAYGLVREYGCFAVEDVLLTVEERGDQVQNPAAFVVTLLKSRFDGSAQVITAAEGLFLALQAPDGSPRISWTRALDLTNQYGATAVNHALRSMHDVPNLSNPVGFVVAVLRRGQSRRPGMVRSRSAVVKLLVEAVQQRNPARALSKARAQELVKTYGPGPVANAVTVMQGRGNIENPAGFVITLLRSEAKSQQKAHWYAP